MANFDNIIQEINTNLPDNNAQEITAKRLRDTLIDLTDAVDDAIGVGGEALQEEIQLIKDDLYGTDVIHVTGTITQSMGVSYPKIIFIGSSNQFKVQTGTTASQYVSWMFPMQANTTYTLSFNGLGVYTTLKNTTLANGTVPEYGINSTTMYYINAGDYPKTVTVEGVAGEYLYSRADTISAGRAFPASITYDRIEGSGEGIFVLKTSITNTVADGNTNPVSSNGVYDAIATVSDELNENIEEIKSYLPQVCNTEGRINIDVNSLTLSNLGPNTTTVNKKRILSNLIPQINKATSLNARLKEGSNMWINLLVYDASSAAWIDKTGSSTGQIVAPNLATINYPVPFESNGIRLYMGYYGSSQNITAAEARAAIDELYYTVPAGCELVPAVSEEYVNNAIENIQKEISILFIGNSLTQDGVAYLPYVLTQLAPNVKYKFYMWYNAGYTLAQQYSKFTSNGKAEIFSVCEDGYRWINSSNSVTMQSILSTYQFDIVCLQEYFNYKTTYTDCTDFNNCVSYIKTNYSKPFKVVSLFHAPLRSNAETVFNRTVEGNKLILEQTISEELITPGIAVYNALSTELDSLGDKGHLSPDGTHTQEGLPCLLQTYNIAMWIFKELGITQGVYNSGIKITTDIYNSINVPGANLGTGVIEGTDAQNLLAQEVAIKSFKQGKGIEDSAFINLTT